MDPGDVWSHIQEAVPQAWRLETRRALTVSLSLRCVAHYSRSITVLSGHLKSLASVTEVSSHFLGLRVFFEFGPVGGLSSFLLCVPFTCVRSWVPAVVLRARGRKQERLVTRCMTSSDAQGRRRDQRRGGYQNVNVSVSQLTVFFDSEGQDGCRW